ncbi:MAG: ATP synthase F1 subunit gamma [Opitutae bacterium]|jgi:F-type H+-transporting ATPase subunit gamma|nr:ATP synthase F1 subunit gamma [Opitutae bacterium]MBT4667187.1 ATP synthase F1 subunit gamma [Opitutae bacterium]MBT5910102.1 ATP synthase F1 subunit gamma [Opitutae bacterium]MBT6850295.1 ATP synthase F1 subunit gamma [Opitutae bacterium]MBT7924379.1 ATP synthase F1 subunit gamma [Opitutae bacterium]
MANTRDIRNRIKGVKNTRQITKAMQMVATSKMKRAQESAKCGRPYALLLADVIGSLSSNLQESGQAFFESRPVKHRGVLVLSTDKGLCGALNANLFRIVHEVDASAKFVAVGKRATQYLSRTRRDLLADFTVSDRAPFSEVRKVVEFLLHQYLEEKIDSVEVAYTSFVNTLQQEPEIVQLLPFSDLETMLATLHARFGSPDDELAKDSREILFEPGREEILAELASLYVKQEIYQLILESQASEHSARMVAMKNATDNAGNLVDDLTLQYNRARQAAITQEIIELSAAAFSDGA